LAWFVHDAVVLQSYNTLARSPIAATVNNELPTGRHPSNNLLALHTVNIVETIVEVIAVE